MGGEKNTTTTKEEWEFAHGGHSYTEQKVRFWPMQVCSATTASGLLGVWAMREWRERKENFFDHYEFLFLVFEPGLEFPLQFSVCTDAYFWILGYVVLSVGDTTGGKR